MRKRKPPLLACMDMTCTDATWSSTKPAPWSHAHPAVVVTAAGTVVVATAAGAMGVAVGMQANAKGVTPAHVMAQAVMAVASATNGVMATEVTGGSVRTAAMATVKTAVFAAPTATHAVVGAGAVAIKPAL